MCSRNTPETEGCKHSCVLRWKYEGSEPFTFVLTPLQAFSVTSLFYLSWLSLLLLVFFYNKHSLKPLQLQNCWAIYATNWLYNEFKKASHVTQGLTCRSQGCFVSLLWNFLDTRLTFLLHKTKTQATCCLRVMTKWGRNPQQLHKHRCATYEINILQLGGSALSTTCVFQCGLDFSTDWNLARRWVCSQRKMTFPVLCYRKNVVFYFSCTLNTMSYYARYNIFVCLLFCFLDKQTKLKLRDHWRLKSNFSRLCWQTVLAWG